MHCCVILEYFAFGWKTLSVAFSVLVWVTVRDIDKLVFEVLPTMETGVLTNTPVLVTWSQWQSNHPFRWETLPFCRRPTLPFRDEKWSQRRLVIWSSWQSNHPLSIGNHPFLYERLVLSKKKGDHKSCLVTWSCMTGKSAIFKNDHFLQWELCLLGVYIKKQATLKV